MSYLSNIPMKKYITFLILLLLLPIMSTAQQYSNLWKQVNRQASLRPRDAIIVLDQIVEKAQQEQNYRQLLRAEIRRRAIWIQLSPDSVLSSVELIKQTERRIRETDPVLSALYCAALSHWAVNDSTPYAQMALSHPDLLAKTKARAYADFALVQDLNPFVSDDLLSVIGYTVGNFELLNRYYDHVGNRPAALLSAVEDLRQKTDMAVGQRGESKFIGSLDSLIDRYQDLDVAAEAAIMRYDLLKNRGKASDSTLLTDAEKYVRQWPRYPRTDYFRNEVSRLTQSVINIDNNDIPVWVPAKGAKLMISHTNINVIDMRIGRVNDRKVDDVSDVMTHDDLEQLAKHHVKWLLPYTRQWTMCNDNRLKSYKDSLVVPPLDAGVYLLELKTNPKTEIMRLLFFMSNVRPMIIPLPHDSVRVVVVDAVTGHPLPDAMVRVEQQKARKVDANGEIHLAVDKDKDDYLYCYTANDRYCPPLALGSSNDYKDHVEEAKGRTVAQIYLDRAIYRPGQTLHATAIVHHVYQDVTQSVSGKQMMIRLLDTHGKVIDSLQVTTDAYGTCKAIFTLPEKTMNGLYRIELNGRNTYFKIEEYKRPTFLVTLNIEEERYKAGDTIHLKGKAQSLMGEPVRRGRVTYTKTGNDKIQTDTLYTDDKGQFEIILPLVSKDKYGYAKDLYCINMDGTVLDGAGEEVGFHQLVRFGKAAVRVALNVSDDILFERDSVKNLQFMLFNAVEKEVPGTVNYWIKGYENDRRTAKCGEKGQIIVPASIPNGRVELVATCEEDTLHSTLYLFNIEASRPCYTTNAWFYCSRNDFGIDDQEEVVFQIGSSRKQVHVVYNIFSGNSVIEEGLLTLDDTVITRRFRYKQAYGSGIRLCYAWYLDGQLYHVSQVIVRQHPDKKLKMTWKTFRDQLAPGTKETWKMNITTPDGRPVTAQLMATMYDKSLDQLFKQSWSFDEGIYLEAPLNRWESMEDVVVHNIHLNGNAPLNYLDYPDMPSWRMLDIPGGPLLIRGRVMDSAGEPLIGAVVRIENTQTVVITDLDGHYELNASYGNRLLIEYIGFEPVRLMAMRSLQDVVLEYSKNALEEVVVVGYGKQPKGMVTGAARSLKSTAPVINKASMVKEALSSKVSGLAIRGNSSLSGSRAGALAYEDEEAMLTDEQLKYMSSLSVRQNLEESAFYYPDLMADEQGNVAISFTLPESLTAWQFRALAHTKDMRNGLLESVAIAKKDFMVQPNMPRFVRMGDYTTISSRIINTTKKALKGKVTMLLLDPETEKPVYTQTKMFSVLADSMQTVAFGFQAKETMPDLLICKIVASDGLVSDGEQHYLPVLTAQEQVMHALPFVLNQAGKKQIDVAKLFPKELNATAAKPQLTVEYTENPSWMVLQALHEYAHPVDECAICQSIAYYALGLGRYIVNASDAVKRVAEQFCAQPDSSDDKRSKLLQNEELKQVLLSESPWTVTADVETEQKKQLADFLNTDGVQNKINMAIHHLRSLQLKDGSWPWFKGMTGSPYITRLVVQSLARLNALIGKQQNTKWMLDEAFRYLSKQDVTYNDLYLYAMDGRTFVGKQKSEFNALVRKLKKAKDLYSIYDMALAATVLYHQGEARQAGELVEALKQYTVFDETKGRYYDTPKAGYSWLDYKIPTQVAAIEAIKTVTPDDEKTIAEMQQWLLQEKRSQYWLTSINSANAIYAFLCGPHPFTTSLSNDRQTTIKIDGQVLSTPQNTSVLGYQKTRTPYTRQQQLTIEKQSDGVSWGAAYAQYLQPMQAIEASGSDLKVERQIIPSQRGPLKVGDKVKVRITLTAARDLDFVQIVDKRAACMEPVEQQSGYSWGLYCDMKDNRTVYFIDMLPKGKRVIEKEFYLDRAGTYETGSITAQCAYAPEFAAIGKSAVIIVK